MSAFSLARRPRSAEIVHIGRCGLPYPFVAEVVGREGFGAMTLDALPGRVSRLREGRHS